MKIIDETIVSIKEVADSSRVNFFMMVYLLREQFNIHPLTAYYHLIRSDAYDKEITDFFFGFDHYCLATRIY